MTQPIGPSPAIDAQTTGIATLSAPRNLPRWPDHAAALLNAFHRHRRPLAFELGGRTLKLSIAPATKTPTLPLTYDLRLAGGIARLSMEGAALVALSAHLPDATSLLDADRSLQALWLEFALIEQVEALENQLGGPIRLHALRGVFAGNIDLRLSLQLHDAERLHHLYLELDHEAATRLLALIAHGWPSSPRSAHRLAMALSLSAGHQRLSIEELASLRPGDVVMLERDNDEETLELAGRPIAQVGGTPPRLLTPRHRWTHGETPMTDHRTAPAAPDELDDLDQLPLRLVAELGHFELTLGELRELGEGSVLPVERPLDDSVLLRINGKRVGSGRLVQLGEKLGVQITRMPGDE